MGLRNLQGTPWHLENLHSKENDDRRYKGRCKYYSDSDNSCVTRGIKCVGSAHCEAYEEMTDEEFKQK